MKLAIWKTETVLFWPQPATIRLQLLRQDTNNQNGINVMFIYNNFFYIPQCLLCFANSEYHYFLVNDIDMICDIYHIMNQYFNFDHF